MSGTLIQQRRVRRFWGGLLVTVGVLIAGLCGLCTMVFVGLTLDQPVTLILPLVFGGPPILVGLLLVWAGRRILRQSREPGEEMPEKILD